jgi:hypothetical protein
MTQILAFNLTQKHPLRAKQAAFCLKIPDDGHNRFIAVSTKEVLHLVRTLFLAVLTTLFVLRGTVPSGLEIRWRRGP